MKRITMRVWAAILSILILIPQGAVLRAQEDLPEDGTPVVVEEDPSAGAPDAPVTEAPGAGDTQDPEKPQEPQEPQESQDPQEPEDPQEPQEPEEPTGPEEPEPPAVEPLPAPTDFAVEILKEEERLNMKWTPVEGADGYEIQYTVDEEFVEVKTITIDDGAADHYENLLFLWDSGITYYVRIRTLSAAETDLWSEAITFMIEEEVPEVPQITAAVNHKDKAIKVSWADAGADAYELRVIPESGAEEERILSVGSGVALKEVTGLTAGASYRLQVRGQEDDVWSEWSTPVTITVDFFKPTLSSVANNSGAALNVAWNQVPGASGFELQYATNSKYTGAQIVQISGSGAVSGKIPSLKADTTYYVRLRAYKMIDGVKVNTGWTKSKKAKVTFYTPTFVSLTNKAWKTMTVKWQVVTSAVGYQIQYADNSKMTSAKTVTIKNGATTSKKIAKLVKYKTYYVRIRAYKKVDGKNVFSSWSGKKKIKIKYNLNSKNLSVPCRMQYPSLPNGCEAVALTNVLLFYGYNLSTTYLADKIIPRSTSNFVTKYWGNPHDSTGNSIAAPGLAMAANKYLKKKKSTMQAYNLTGATFSSLLDHIEEGRPVIIWTTMYQAKLGKQYAGTQYYQGVAYKVYSNSHTVVLKGFDRKKGKVYLSDSISGVGTYDLKWIKSLYEARGSQAVVIY
ncbi:MAG: C39 family peptidase [Clostridiales bacterium]|nr:C39 family peptidase [Clostridiales bacterium]